MSLNQYEADYRVRAVQEQRRQDVMRAQQIHLARGGRPHVVVSAASNLRNLVASMLIGSGERVRQEPVIGPEPDAQPVAVDSVQQA